MPHDKRLTLVTKLAEQTRTGTVEWKASVQTGVYQVSFRDNSVQIFCLQNEIDETEMDVHFRLINGDGIVVEEFTEMEISDEIPFGEPRKKFFKDMKVLFDTARRIALGSEQVMNEIIDDLNKLPPF